MKTHNSSSPVSVMKIIGYGFFIQRSHIHNVLMDLEALMNTLTQPRY